MVLNEPQISMAEQVKKIILGADISKDWIDLYDDTHGNLIRVDNQCKSIDAVLKNYPGAAIAVEATNTFHELLVERARALGLQVYIIDGYQFSHYAKSIIVRMRNDRVDARLLARYLGERIGQLRPHTPKPAHLQRLWRLLKRRALLVKQRGQLRQSFAGLAEMSGPIQALQQHIQQVIAVIDQQMLAMSRRLHWTADLTRLRSIPGVGELTSYALLIAYRTHQFRHVDAYIAFMGMDVKTKDSGIHRGKRKLTKQGDPEYRRLLYNAGMAAMRSCYYAGAYQAAVQRGISTTGAFMLIGRKLARLAYVFLNKQLTFDPKCFKGACFST